jgi:hypothetical protein
MERGNVTEMRGEAPVEDGQEEGNEKGDDPPGLFGGKFAIGSPQEVGGDDQGHESAQEEREESEAKDPVEREKAAGEVTSFRGTVRSIGLE